MFNFTGGSNTYYGWLEILAATEVTSDQFNVTLGRFAYDNTPGSKIKAGEVGSAPVPEIGLNGMASALALAGGALSLLESRRKRGADEAMAGALVSGAKGLRRFRREQAAAKAAAV